MLALLSQGFPILINGTTSGEHKSESLLKMSIEVAHLAGNIVNACPIHQTQHSTVEPSQKAGNRASPCLTGIFP